MRLKFIMILFCFILVCGCICNPGHFFSNESNTGDDGLLGDLDSLTGDEDSGEESNACNVPSEAASLTEADCKKIKNALEKAGCFTAVALKTGDSKICEQLREELMYACISLVAECKKDETLCDDRISDLTYQWGCISGVAKAKKDVSLCEPIENPAHRNPCIEGVAAAKKDVSLCNMIEENSSRDDCIVEVAIAAEDPSLCSQLSSSLDYWKYQCLMNVGMAAQDMEVCNRIPLESRAEEDMAEKCIKNVSSGKNQGVCNQISDAEFRDYYCLTQIALEQKDVSVCDRITDKERKNNCIKVVAIARRDVTLCEKIVIKDGAFIFPDDLNECVTEIAKATHNKAICDKAYDKAAKERCKSQVT